jgi:hypothetical protein
MIALLLLIPAVGAILGLRFEVVVLAPAMLLFSAVTVAFGTASSQGVPTILLMVFASLALLQIGYFTGCVLHGYLTFKSKEHDRRSERAVWSVIARRRVLLYAGNNLDKALEIFAAAIKHRPRIRLTIRQRTRVFGGSKIAIRFATGRAKMKRYSAG